MTRVCLVAALPGGLARRSRECASPDLCTARLTPRRARSIAIFCACLALAKSCEIVIFSPARRASRKLLERVVEFLRLLDCEDRIIEVSDCLVACCTRLSAFSLLSVQYGSVPHQQLRRQQITDPVVPVRCLCLELTPANAHARPAGRRSKVGVSDCATQTGCRAGRVRSCVFATCVCI